MILDTSAILAVLLEEPEQAGFLRKIGEASVVGVGAPTLTETSVVLAARLGSGAALLLDQLIARAGLVVIPFESAHWRVASDAWLRFGRGRHPAALNLGDCLSYATARVAGRPLLCKGEDFPRTDLDLA